MKNILVPSDFSSPSKEAFKFAIQVASRIKGQITVMHSIYYPVAYAPQMTGEPTLAYNPEILNEFIDDAKMEFEAMRQANGDQDVPISLKIIHGDVISAINQCIKKFNIDLVIMGTSGVTGWQEFFIGSTTEKVVRNAPVPVMAIKTCPEISQIKKILLSSTLELNQDDFMEKVKALQDIFQAELHVVRVNTPRYFRPDAEDTMALKEFARHYQLRNFKLYAVNDWNENLGILNFANDNQMDMIAMATHSRRGLAHLFNGSIAESVVNHLPCPVWTYSIKKK